MRAFVVSREGVRPSRGGDCWTNPPVFQARWPVIIRAMLKTRLPEYLEPRVSIIVGTVSAERMPACCRAIAIRADDELSVFTVYVPVATSEETIANVASTRRIAVVCSRPLTHSTVQIEGTVREVRLAPEGERAFVSGRLAAFADELGDLGFPRGNIASLAHWPAFAIELAAEELYEQTPGPDAGISLQ
jgi:hypothetical protein